jgi:hypothetical protein
LPQAENPFELILNALHGIAERKAASQLNERRRGNVFELEEDLALPELRVFYRTDHVLCLGAGGAGSGAQQEDGYRES